MEPGRGIFSALFEELEKLRKKRTLVARVVMDVPLPGRTAASMQVWLLHPDKDRNFKVLTSLLTPSAACIKWLRRFHSKGVLGLELFAF